MNEDKEQAALSALVIAAADLLEAQAQAQPAAMPAINAAIASAAALRVEVEIQARTMFASVRLTTTDGEGNEVALIRSMNGQPAPRATVQ